MVFTTAAALCQHHKNCFVYSIFCTFYVLLTHHHPALHNTACLTMFQTPTPLYWAEERSAFTAILRPHHACGDKMAETGHRGRHRHWLIACSCRTQGIRKRRHRAGLCVRASIHSVCLKEEGIWDLPCQGQMKTERKTSPRAQAFRRRMEFNLISYEPCTFPLRLKASGEGPMPSCDNSCLCQLAHR